MENKKEIILKMLHDEFKDCTFQVQGYLVWVTRGSVVIHTLDFNTLTYYFETNQLEKYLKELK